MVGLLTHLEYATLKVMRQKIGHQQKPIANQHFLVQPYQCSAIAQNMTPLYKSYGKSVIKSINKN